MTEKYDEEKVKLMLEKISKILLFHGNTLVQIAHKTEITISSIMDKIFENGNVHIN